MAVLNWELGPNRPRLSDELFMKKLLVLSSQESGRALDLPLERREVIAREASLRNFTLPACYSLRRQLLRQATSGSSTSFYDTKSMGDEKSAKDHADNAESLVRAWLDANHIPYMTEMDLLKLGSSHTPDFLLLGSVIINSVRVRWIDVKTYYGSSSLCLDERLPIGKILAQAERYNSAFTKPGIEETGAFIFLAGKSSQLEEELVKGTTALRIMPLLLNAHPLDTSSLYDGMD